MLIAILWCPASAQALTRHGDFSFHIAGGGFFPLVDDDDPFLSVANGFMTEAEIAALLTPEWEIGLRAGWGEAGLAYQGDRIGRVRMVPVGATLRYRLFPEDNIVPFGLLAAGRSFQSTTEEELDFSVEDNWFWQAGGGMDVFLTPAWVIRLEGSYLRNETEVAAGTIEHDVDLGAFVTTMGITCYW